MSTRKYFVQKQQQQQNDILDIFFKMFLWNSDFKSLIKTKKKVLMFVRENCCEGFNRLKTSVLKHHWNIIHRFQIIFRT